MRGSVWATVALGSLILGSGGVAASALAQAPVVVVPIQGTVDEGMVHLVERSVEQANAQHAPAVVLDVDSAGGMPAAALRIRDALFGAREPVIAYVDRQAYSAAALIVLSANHIVMAPGASLGDAEPVPATPQSVSSLRGDFESTAQRNDRNPIVAAAMVDKGVPLPQYKPTGSLLTLDTDDALHAGIAEATAPNLDAALAQYQLGAAPRTVQRLTWGEQLAQFATDPVVSGLLLAIGILGLLIEMQTLHGIAGVIGVAALALFFGAHIYAGFSNGLVAVLAVLGLIGIVWELHVVPGHGIPGILGGIALLLAVLFAFGLPFIFVAVETLATAIVLAVIGFSLVVRKVPENAWAHRLALAAAQGPEYVTSGDFSGLRGRTGTAATYLRPAGIASIDGRRVDVLTAGEFIAQGTPIRVVRVEGARVFVEAE